MTMFAPLPAQDLLPMELPASTSSRAASRAKTFQQQADRLAWGKAPEAACGPKSSDWLASYHHPTSSWRTSQTCLVALATGAGDGLAEFSETWPSSGIMRNGRTYRRRPWALPIAENASGLLPTPTKSDPQLERRAKAATGAFVTSSGTVRNMRPDGRSSNLGLAGTVMWPTPTATMFKGSSPAALTRKNGKDRSRDRLDHCLQDLEGSGELNPEWVEWLMGFPTGHTDLRD